jgi:hypothetical protein
MYAGLGEKEQALAWGEKAYEERSDHLRSMQSEPIADPIRVGPGFKGLTRRIGLLEQDVRQFLASPGFLHTILEVIRPGVDRDRPVVLKNPGQVKRGVPSEGRTGGESPGRGLV